MWAFARTERHRGRALDPAVRDTCDDVLRLEFWGSGPGRARAGLGREAEALFRHAVGNGEHLASDRLQIDLGAQQPGRHPLDDAPFPDRGGVKA